MWVLLLILCLLSGLKKSLSNISRVDGMSVARDKPESHRLQLVAYFFGLKTASCFFARCRSSSWGETIIWSFYLLRSVRLFIQACENTFGLLFIIETSFFLLFCEVKLVFFHARIFNCLFLRIKYGYLRLRV